MSGLERRLERVERATGGAAGRQVLLVVPPNYTRDDVARAYASSKIEPREDDELLLVVTGFTRAGGDK